MQSMEMIIYISFHLPILVLITIGLILMAITKVLMLKVITHILVMKYILIV